MHVKIQVFCPKDSEDVVRLAIGEAGGGRIGNYDHCISVTDSVGYFRPLEGAHPSVGEMNVINKVEEVKLEFVCDEADASRILSEIKKVHPYEEVSCDIIPLVDPQTL